MSNVIAECEANGNEAEKALIEACRAGGECILNGGELPEEGAEDASTIRAALIRALALEKTSLHEKGVALSGAVVTGPLDLSFAKCRGRLALNNCRFTDKPQMAQTELAQLSLDSSAFPSLYAQGAIVAGSIFLNCVTATGTVDVNSAQFGGSFVGDGATLYGDGGMALYAQGVIVTGDMFLRRVTATGAVNVMGAQIGGQLACVGATLNSPGGTALNCYSIRVERGLFLREVKIVTGWIDLSSAHAGDLVDDATFWALPTGVSLDGFTYDRISGGIDTPKTFAARENWLAKVSRYKGEFRPQPYTQFAKAMRAAGHLGEARKALVVRDTIQFEEAEKADRKAWQDAYLGTAESKGDSGWIWLRLQGRRLWAGLSRRVIGHGHHPQYALFWSLGLWAVGTIAYFTAYSTGLMVPNSDVIMVSAEWLAAVAQNGVAPTDLWTNKDALASIHYESFFAAIFALDVFLPLVDLGQESTWAVTTTTNWGICLRVATFLCQVAGWVVTSLGIAAVTGFVQRNAPD